MNMKAIYYPKYKFTITEAHCAYDVHTPLNLLLGSSSKNIIQNVNFLFTY